MRVLVVNAGSSSVKLSVLGPRDEVLASESVPVRRNVWDRGALEAALGRFPAPDAVGHRVVHGGREFVSPVRLDARVLGRLRALGDLAPLHQPKSLAGIEAIERALPGLEAVACFDTAFHAGIPQEASTYAVPERWRSGFGVRRFGFHGLSHAYASRRAGEVTGGARRVVVAHLGAGASLAAVLEGRGVDTTMGFTPLEGLVMATRSGSVDPGMVLWLHQHAGVGVEEIADALEHRSGLLALAGTADMREVLARSDARAVLAAGVYVHRLRAGVAAMAASLGGLDVLVFTGGVGEGSAVVRGRVAEGLGFLGVGVDAAANEGVGVEGEVSAAGAAVRTLVVHAREDVEVARGVREVVGRV
ncbi:acetate/propionate family kinase [Nocardiopsis sp. CT-R113]|uniref:Acetate kinase n=1 Tax=Nocardiopsis codii TaxID=3065942 RepID=A0ABU7KHJ9_9ACTN|nr:acetate/propionate family kinase [Nocardiopsis sp. CT-R113]MEE2041720.1 acetate/propionate family kinase [Nocardiopsis sp. CT-R113]